MQAVLNHPPCERRADSARVFLLSALLLLVASGILCSLSPVWFSLAIVFLFAGPHNWFEFRYFLAKTPSALGPLRWFFVAAVAGVAVLAGAYLALTLGGRAGLLSGPMAAWGTSLWLLSLAAWALALFIVRGASNSKRGLAVAALLSAAACLLAFWQPLLVFLGLVYLHPLSGLWILDRELRRRPQWRASYHRCLCLLPVVLALMWSYLLSLPELSVDDPLHWSLLWQSGGVALPVIPAQVVIATHAFLEMLHYGVWILAIPLATKSASGWRLMQPLPATRLPTLRLAVACLLAGGLFVVAFLWLALAADYTLARELYFRLAIVHVLAEIPLLMRLP